MEKILITCPFTGVRFEAFECADGSLQVKHPITGEEMRIGYNAAAKRYLIDKRLFKNLDLVTSSAAAEILGVSRARISNIIRDDTIPHFKVNGRHMFLRSDIMDYARNRTIGRPVKAG